MTYDKPQSHGRKTFVLIMCVPLLSGAWVGRAVAQTQESDAKPAQPATAPSTENLTAPQAVRRGNALLKSGNATDALDAYKKAEKLRPDAREIAFAEGLAHYDLGEFDEARSAFREAAATGDDELAADARYSLGTCDHAEALKMKDNPQQAISLLENAMRQYQNVLADRPDHKEARDANYKAASMWRQIKKMLEQQPKQQQDKDQNKNDKDQSEDQKKQDQRQSENQDKKDQKQQDQQSSQQQDKKDEQQQQQSGEQKDDQEDQKQEQSSDAEKKQEQQDQKKQSDAQKQEGVSREQAQRKLREMMQALRDRQKARRQTVQRAQVRPVDKDW